MYETTGNAGEEAASGRLTLASPTLQPEHGAGTSSQAWGLPGETRSEVQPDLGSDKLFFN